MCYGVCQSGCQQSDRCQHPTTDVLIPGVWYSLHTLCYFFLLNFCCPFLLCWNTILKWLVKCRNILWMLCSSLLCLLSQPSIRTDFKIGFLSLRVFLCLCSQHFYNVLLWAKIWLLGSGTFNVFYFFPTEV